MALAWELKVMQRIFGAVHQLLPNPILDFSMLAIRILLTGESSAIGQAVNWVEGALLAQRCIREELVPPSQNPSAGLP